MKKLVILFFSIGFYSLVFAQSYNAIYHTYGDLYASKAALLLNTDNDDAGKPEGWSLALDTGKINRYSKSTAIPFAFQFAAQSVTHFKISSTGFITFDTTALGIPSAANENFPSAKLPVKSVGVWGITGNGNNDFVYTKVFGKAPNRQFWIKYNSYSNQGDTAGNWNYWSIVLEESSNRIFLVSMYMNNAIGKYTAPKINCGIQISAVIGKNFTPVAGNYPQQNSALDNKYLVLEYGTPKTKDINTGFIQVSDFVQAGGNIAYTAHVENFGSAQVDSIFINIRINNGAVNQSKIVKTIAPFGYGNYQFSNSIPAVAVAGNFNNVALWVTNADGSADQDHSNDTVTAKILSVNGNSAFRRLLIEGSAATWCGYCPQNDFRSNEIKAQCGDSVVIVNYHYKDQMASNSDTIIENYYKNVGNLFINRTINKNETAQYLEPNDYILDNFSYFIRKPAFSYTPVDLKITNINLDTISHKFTYKVKLTFTDFCTGNLRVGGLAVEDAVRGVGTGWDQQLASALYTNINSPFYQHSNLLRSYYHDNVVWYMQGGYNGLKTNKTGIYKPGDTAIFNFSYRYPQLLKTTTISISPYYPIGLIYSYGKPRDMRAVAYVALDHGNSENYIVLNAAEKHLWDITTSVSKHSMGNVNIYPNPSNGEFNIQIKDGNYQLILSNISGSICFQNKVLSNNGKIAITAQNYGLHAGMYLVQLQSEKGELFSGKIIIQ